MPSIQFLSNRTDLADTRTENLPDWQSIKLHDQVVLGIEKFALTANNITYAVAGDMIGYWNFFPAEKPWGLIPVWGISTVLRSDDPSIHIGDRFYGYYPMASYLVVQPDQVTSRGFSDASEHRRELPSVYNQYSLMTAENGYDPHHDDHRMVFWPLFATSFVLDDLLDDNQNFGADNIILSSASSKTSLGLAFLLHHHRKVNVIGLTSSGNKSFVENLGLYHQVLSYEDIEQLPTSDKVAFVDMAGNRQVLARLHHHFGDMMASSIGVGITHWTQRDGEDPASLPGAKPTGFFAPTQIQKRNKDWGPVEVQRRMNDAWLQFLTQVDQWITIKKVSGIQSLSETYQLVLAGAPPDQGYVVSLDQTVM